MKPLYVKKNGVVYKISGAGMPALYPAANVEYDNTVTSELQATDVQGAIDELSTRQDTNTKNTAYGTCDTAGDVKDKVATLSNATNWVLEVGTIVGVRFTYTNTYTPSSGNNVTLNVNNTGAKNICYGDGTVVYSSTYDAKNPTAFGEAGQTIYYMYDGTYWVWVSHSKDSDTLYNFKGNEFRSADENNYNLESGYGGNANYMVVNGHYYYNSNGPSTDIGASANDGAIYVQAYDEDNVTQIAQNYETGNIFVRSKVNGSWTEWKKTIANITANNTVLTTDKTPFLTRQTLNPTGFSSYVREKLVGASYAWNQLVQNGNFADGTTGWSTYQATISASNNVCTMVRAVASGSNSMYRVVTKQPNHKYLWLLKVKNNVGSNSIMVQWFKSGTSGSTISLLANTGISNSYTTYSGINATDNSDADGAFIIFLTTATVNNSIDIKEVQVIDLTLAFGSTIADYLYNLANNGGITKLRDMGCPIDKYTPYGYGLYSVKTSGKKIVGKNLLNLQTKASTTSQGITYRYEEDNTLIASGTSTGSLADMVVNFVKPIKFKANTPYTISVRGTTATFNSLTLYLLTTTVSWTSPIGIDSTGIKTFAFGSDIEVTRFQFRVPNTNTININAHIQIEEGSTATTYEPYSLTTYSLGNDELRGLFKLVNNEIVADGDVKESNGKLTRKQILVNLGDLNWEYNSASNRLWFIAPANDLYKAFPETSAPLIICSRYVATAVNDIVASATLDKVTTISQNKRVIVRDLSYTDAATFKTAMNGVYVLLELATPTTEQSTPFADPMSLVGATTEEYIDTRDIPCPVGAERQYMGQSDDIIEIPSSPQSDGKRVLISEVSGGKEQVYWDIPKLYYKEYTVQGDGTKTYGNLLAELKPYYEALSEDEKTYSKVMMRATSSGNECLTFVGNYWYSRMGVNSSGLWLDQIDFQNNKYFKQVSGGSITEYTDTNAGTNVIALRVLTYTRAES